MLSKKKNKDCQTEDNPLAEYSETVEASSKTKKSKSNKKNMTRWRDVDSIEKKVDVLHIANAKKPSSTVDKTVDKLIEKRKKK